MAQKITPAVARKRWIVRDAIRKVVPECKANFEIPMSALNYINYGNRMREKPVKVSYEYVYKTMHEMIRNREI